MKRSQGKSSHIPRVFAVVSMQSSYGPSVLRGIFAHIAAHGAWGLEIIRSATDFSAETVERAIAHKTDGIIIALNDNCDAAYRALVANQLPFVTVEGYSSTLAARKHNARHIRIDNVTIGRDAARNFLRQGRYLSFGFVPPRSERPWSLARQAGFNQELERRGHHADAFVGSHTADAVARRGDLAKWLRKLDKRQPRHLNA